MPGAFAHLCIANKARENKSLQQLDVDNKIKLLLAGNLELIELGCVGPDYPYLVLKLFERSTQTRWADLMHFGETKAILESLITQTKSLPDEEKQIVFPWLAGYVSHVIADATIHPVVELKVGPYHANQKAHRVCEMNQDSYIWVRQMALGEVGYADRIEMNLTKFDAEDGLNHSIAQVWQNALKLAHPDDFAADPPDINSWHKGFKSITGSAEESHKLFKWARHVAVNAGLTYPAHNEVEETYIYGLETPTGQMDYEAIFDLAVQNVREHWVCLASAVFGEGDTSMFKKWNLDNGIDEETGKITLWEAKP